MHCEAEGMCVCACVRGVTLGAETKEKEAKFAWVEEESHLEDSRADRGGAVGHTKKRGSNRKRDKSDIGV